MKKQALFSSKDKRKKGLIFSLPGRSPGRAIVLPLALVLALASTLVVVSVLAKC